MIDQKKKQNYLTSVPLDITLILFLNSVRLTSILWISIMSIVKNLLTANMFLHHS